MKRTFFSRQEKRGLDQTTTSHWFEFFSVRLLHHQNFWEKVQDCLREIDERIVVLLVEKSDQQAGWNVDGNIIVLFRFSTIVKFLQVSLPEESMKILNRSQIWCSFNTMRQGSLKTDFNWWMVSSHAPQSYKMNSRRKNYDCANSTVCCWFRSLIIFSFLCDNPSF